MTLIKNLILAVMLIFSLAACGATTPAPPVTSVPDAAITDEQALAERQRTSAYISGDLFYANAYCVGEDLEFIRNFSDDIVRNGVERYFELMRAPSIPCYDMRLHNVSPIVVILQEKLWRMTLPSGEELDMWFAEDEDGTRGYVWVQRREPGADFDAPPAQQA